MYTANHEIWRGSVKVWGCISCDGIGLITKVEGRMNGKDYIRLLSRHLLPYMQSCVMDDNAPCHLSQASNSVDF